MSDRSQTETFFTVTHTETCVCVSFHGRGGPKESFTPAQWEAIIKNFKNGTYDRPKVVKTETESPA